MRLTTLKKHNLALLEVYPVKQFYIDYLWKTYAENTNSNFYIPNYIDYHLLSQEDKTRLAPNLTWRTINTICEQAISIVSGVLKAKANAFYALKKCQEENDKLWLGGLP